MVMGTLVKELVYILRTVTVSPGSTLILHEPNSSMFIISTVLSDIWVGGIQFTTLLKWHLERGTKNKP